MASPSLRGGGQSEDGSRREVRGLRSWPVLKRVLLSGGAFTIGETRSALGCSEAFRLECGLRGGAALAAYSSLGGCAAPFGGCERPSRFGSLLVRVVKSGRTERSSASKSGSTGNELFGATTSRFCSRRVAFGLVFKGGVGATALSRRFGKGLLGWPSGCQGDFGLERRVAEKLGRSLRLSGWWFLHSSAVAQPGLG